MFRRSGVFRELQNGIRLGRLKLAEQFSTMDGWQRRQDTRFDAYVTEKRQKQYFDSFDQRVERAFRVAARAQKSEVINAFKRKVKNSHTKWTAAVMLEVKAAVEERLRWLRDVWTQIDADYRSTDVERQKKAAREISDALRGEPSAYMQWVYERKREDRFLGPKEKAAHDVELSAAELPDVTEDEVNHYHNLPLRMADIEYNVKSRFGMAGKQHWAELQRAKDEAYEQKLDAAANVYEKLLDQSSRYDESRRTALLRSNVERVHQAQVRFKASMEMEKERERLVEAHEVMREERAKAAKAERIAILQETAELRRSGASSDEVRLLARQRQLEAHARRQAEYQLKERDMIQHKKTHYLDMIERFKTEVERREGEEMLRHAQPAALRQSHNHSHGHQGDNMSSTAHSAVSAFGFMEADRLDDDGQLSTSNKRAGMSSSRDNQGSAASIPGDGATYSSLAETALRSRKTELWGSIEQDRYEDPFLTIHQARLDAAATYDPVYAKHLPLSLAQGKKYSKQGGGENAAGGDMDKQVFKLGARTMVPYQWGLTSNVVHDIDGDGSNDYFFGPEWHVRHPETGDIDWRYEKKKGGAVFRGPRLYRMGAQREAAEPGTATMDPSPATVRRFSPSAVTESERAASTSALPSAARCVVRSNAHAPTTRVSQPPGHRSVAAENAGTPRLPGWRSS